MEKYILKNTKNKLKLNSKKMNKKAKNKKRTKNTEGINRKLRDNLNRAITKNGKQIPS